MKNLKFSLKLFIPHIFILVLLVLGLTANLISLNNIRRQTEDLYNGPFAIKSAAGTAEEMLEAMQTSVYRAIVNDAPDTIDEAISEAGERAVILQEQVAWLKQYHLADMGSLSRLESNLSELAPMQEHVLALAAQNNDSEATAYMEKSNVPVINEAQKELEQYVCSAEAKEQELVSSLQQTQMKAIIFLAAFCVVGTVFTVRDGTYFWRLYKGSRQDSGQYHPAQIK